MKRISHEFNNSALLEAALTHSSFYAGEGEYSRNNERLEFLGDAFLDAIIGAELFERLKESEEGRLTKLRAQIVCEASLAEAARSYGLGEMLRMGRGEEKNGGRQKDSILADAFEAIIGAIYEDGGYEESRKFVLEALSEKLEEVLSGRGMSDFKTAFQEVMQAKGPCEIEYRLAGTRGPDHDKYFFMELYCNGRRMGSGEGRSKKEAAQNAARQALLSMNLQKESKKI